MRVRLCVIRSLLVAGAALPNLACSNASGLVADERKAGGPLSNSSATGESPSPAASSSTEDAGAPGDAGSASAPSTKHLATQLDAAVDANLGPLPALTNVTALEREDSVGIDFDPVDNAVDYRVYPLPDPSTVTTNADGSLTIKNAIYRCAGLRQTFDLPNNTSNSLNKASAGQVYASGAYSWGATVPAKPALGYVYVTPASDRIPVYAIGVHATAPESGWRESRPKIYTTDAAQRQTLLNQGGRDDGIVFYAPAAASAATQTIYGSETAEVVAGQGWTQYSDYYFTAADKAAHAKDTTPAAPAFQVLSAAADGAVPLMSVSYQAPQAHIELAVGNERFKRASNQGQGPLWHLEWSGLRGPTTLVVEALSSGCPYQGLLSPQALSAPPHQPFFTLAQIQQASATGEVYINGQYDLPGKEPGGLALMQTQTASPVPIARSFIQVTPQPHDPSAWDWYEGFSASSVPPSETASRDPKFSGDNASGHWTSSVFDFGAYSIDNPTGPLVFTHGPFLGQFWHVFDDWSQDVTGRLRFTAQQPATVSADASTYLHVTWTVNVVGTDRRYPQLLVTDQPIPVEDGFQNPNGNFLLIQTIEGPSMRLEAQAFRGLVNGASWAVNNQAPNHALIDYDNWNNGNNTNATIPPAEPPFEHAGVDRMTKFDAYISSSTVYVLMDDSPAGCTHYPSKGFALSGTVTVTFGDVLYHEGAQDEGVCDQSKPYGFLHEHQCNETVRHWDDLGIKSGVAAPAWDARFACTAY